MLTMDSETLRMPFWITDKNEVILKPKLRFINTLEINELEEKQPYLSNCEFNSYEFKPDDKEEDIQGYYVKVPRCKKIDNNET